MRISFVYLGSENLGVQYLISSLITAGHEVELFFDEGLFDDKHFLEIPLLAKFFDSKKLLISKVLDSNPDIIAFSVLTHSYQWALTIARMIKEKKNIPVIMGGVHVTLLPDLVLSEKAVDFVCVGEGEEALVEFLNKFPEKNWGGISNIGYKKNGVNYLTPIRNLNTNLDSLPFPAKNYFSPHIDIHSKYLILTARGCPFACTFCNNSSLKEIYKGKGPYVRMRSPENVIEELLFAKKQYNIKMVDFHDDIFTLDANRLDKLLDLYRRHIQLPFTCLSHPLYIDDFKIKILKQSGCKWIQIGVQSTDEEYRKKFLDRVETNKEIEKALDYCKKYDLPFQVDQIFNLPLENHENYVRGTEFYISNKPNRIACFYFTYLPKAKILEKVSQPDEGLLHKISAGLLNGVHSNKKIGDEAVSDCKKFIVLFNLIPLLPRVVSSFFFQTKIYKVFSYFPLSIIVFLDLLNAIKYQRVHTLIYIKNYLKNILFYFFFKGLPDNCVEKFKKYLKS